MDDRFYRKLTEDEHQRLIFLEEIKDRYNQQPRLLFTLACFLFVPVALTVLFGLYIFLITLASFIGLCAFCCYQTKLYAKKATDAVNCYHNYLKKLVNKYRDVDY